MMSPIERAARALCERSGVANPDDLEPGMTPYSDDTEIIDGYLPNGDPGFFVWRLYVGRVRAVLNAIREPSDGMLKAGVLAPNYLEDQSSRRGCRNIYTAMIDAAMKEE